MLLGHKYAVEPAPLYARNTWAIGVASLIDAAERCAAAGWAAHESKASSATDRLLGTNIRASYEASNVV